MKDQIQYDAAVDASVARTKLHRQRGGPPRHRVHLPGPQHGQLHLQDGSAQRSAGAVAIGRVLQGLRRPINDRSRGATVREIVDTVAITTIQAAEAETDEQAPLAA